MLTGLNDRVDIFRYILADDGAGGEVIDEEDIIYTNKSARITVMNAEKQLKEIGIAGKEAWHVLLEYCSELIGLDGDLYLRLTYNAPESVILQGINYRILKNRRQRDENNQSHHTSLIIEREAS